MSTLEQNVARLYWIYAFNSTGFHLVVYTLFILSKGFTMQQFFLIEAAAVIVNVITEIPTGVFSDRIGRKWSLIISSLIGMPTTLFIILSDNFYVVLTAMAMGGLAISFSSGTDTAFLYDTLKALKRENEFNKVFGKMTWFGSWASATGGIIGGFIATYGLSYPWWAAFIVSFPILFITITLREPPLFRESTSDDTKRFHLSESLKYSFRRESGFFVLYASVTWLFFSLGFWLWQPYLKLISVPILYFGFFYAAERLLSGFSAKYAFKIEGKIGISKSLLFIPLILALAFILESKFVVIFGFLFIFLQSISGGYFGPVIADYINSRIPSSRRATVLSTRNALHSLLFAIFSPLLGYTIDIYSLQTGLLIMGILLVIVAIIFYLILRFKTLDRSRPE